MNSRDHAIRHLLAKPSWEQEMLEQQAHDTNYVHVHDFTMRWRRQQEREHAQVIEE
jgi:hypothetical protein